MSKVLKIAIFLILGMMPEWAVHAQSPQKLFNKANHLYQKQSYDSAAKLYHKLIDQGYQNTELYFNAGNVDYKMGQSGYAVYYFTKALQQNPGNEVIKHNLKLARIQASGKVNQIPTLFFVRWWHRALQLFSANTWLILSVIFFWLFIILLGWNRIFPASVPRRIRLFTIVSAVLFCILFTGAIASWIQIQTHNTAIIVEVQYPLRSAPDANGSEIQVLQKGEKVELLDSVSQWRKIRLFNGTEGWIESEEMKTL